MRAALILFLFPIILNAQESYRQYDTQRYFYEHLVAMTGSGTGIETPFDIVQNRLAIDGSVSEIVNEVDLKPMKIDLIFHMLFTDNEKEAENLIKDQVKHLNRDFNSINPPARHPNDPLGQYIRMATNPKIKFNVFTDRSNRSGIATLRQSRPARWQRYDDMKDEALGGAAPFEPDKYINIWVVDMPEGMNSYSTSPYQEDYLAGIVIDYRLFGTQEKGEHGFVEGKTLTHLMGNYLGLNDLWSDYQRCADDGVADTPLHNAQTTGCPEYRHVSTCYKEEYVPAMTMNFMNNTNDECQFMFTEGQVRRMRAMIEIARPSLIK
jgi:hypothetical protein